MIRDLTVEMQASVEVSPYLNSLDHLLAELQRVEAHLQAEVGRFRGRQKSDAGLRGLAIDEDEVDDFLARPPSQSAESNHAPDYDHIREAIDKRISQSLDCGIPLRLVELARLFSLSPYEIDCVLICLAPEVDLGYERLYAYLQDDVTKRSASVDLVLNLLSSSLADRIAGRQIFAADSPLMRHSILRVIEDSNQRPTSLLGSFLRIDARIASYLLGSDECDSRLATHVRVIESASAIDRLSLPAETKERLARIAAVNPKAGPVFFFYGPSGTGKQHAAAAFCAAVGRKLIVVDGAAILNAEGSKLDHHFRLALREAKLQGAAIYWQGFDALAKDEHRSLAIQLFKTLQENRDLAFLAGGQAIASPVETEVPVVSVEFPRPTSSERWQLWTSTLGEHRPADGELGSLAAKFRLTSGQIREAAATARNLAFWRNPVEGRPTLADLYDACRMHSNQKLGSLAAKIKPLNSWTDMVLPADRITQLQDICNHVKYRSLVYDTWGFDRKVALGKGLSVLFSGPPGTGKTMAAGVMAGQLRMDLYKIDLASVVSKYIGETEKNLSKIFAEAETANAILFFDEADALFGKRSEVRDSHDRYANIEVGYLLQRMEEYEGILILCTNFRRNMDDAFVRRLHFTVEFPLPDVRDRRRIWRNIWPSNAPLRELDFDFLAKRFAISGGSIRNIALGAAFLAAADGGSLTMDHVLDATRREYQKMGKISVEGEFELLPATAQDSTGVVS